MLHCCRLIRLACIGLACMAWGPTSLTGPAQADEITYRDDDNKVITTQARLLPAPPGIQLLERWDGQIQILDPSAILDRRNTGDPDPITCRKMGERLQQLFTGIFGPDRVRLEIQEPVVTCLVLSAPLAPKAESAATLFSRKAVRFMINVSDVFEKYARTMDFPLRDFRFPVVLIIFESDSDFDTYYQVTSSGNSLSATSVLGFYSSTTNWLTVRMSSCDSFAVPLHEAIHLQMSNRVLQRLAPIPRWYAEGIANAFEGNGERIDSSPGKVNADYVQRAQGTPPGRSWSDILGEDESFMTDVVAGEAYTLAWCLHWMTSTQNKEGYKRYVQALAERKPLEKVSSRQDAELFEKCFGQSMSQIQADFPRVIASAVRRQKVTITDPATRQETEQQALCQYNISVTKLGNGILLATGSARNLCPFRDMTFYLTIESDGGQFADLLLADLRPRQMQRLKNMPLMKAIPGMPQQQGSTYRVYVRGVPADSEEAAAWKAGRLPGPVQADRGRTGR